jgi:hypothetical protein
MAVTSVKEVGPGRGGAIDERGQRSYQRRFCVIVNDRLDDTIVVGNATGIPRLGDPYVSARGQDNGSVVKTIAPAQDEDNPYLWFVDVEYGALAMDLDVTGAGGTTHTPGLPPNGGGAGGTPDTITGQDPTQNEAEIEIDYIHYSKAIEKTITGQLIVNTAGDPFDPPLEIDEFRMVLRCSRNETAAQMQFALSYSNKTNNAPFAGGNTSTWKMRPPRSRLIGFWNGVAIYRTAYEFEYRPETWALSVLSRGCREKIGTTPVLALDVYGSILPEPILLKVDGTRANTAAEVATQEFTVYNGADYTQLNLPFEGGHP